MKIRVKMSKYICPSRKKEMELKNKSVAVHHQESKKSGLINETDFPELNIKMENKAVGGNEPKEKKKTFLDALEKKNDTESSSSSNEKECKSEKQLKYKREICKGRNDKVKNKFMLDKERQYDKSGWMVNDDWIFWYEQNNPNKLGSF